MRLVDGQDGGGRDLVGTTIKSAIPAGSCSVIQLGQRGGEGGAAGGKFWPATVLAAPAKAGGLFTLAYKDDEANKAKVNLATTKWRPAGAPAPPRFEWSAAAD